MDVTVTVMHAWMLRGYIVYVDIYTVRMMFRVRAREAVCVSGCVIVSCQGGSHSIP